MAFSPVYSAAQSSAPSSEGDLPWPSLSKGSCQKLNHTRETTFMNDLPLRFRKALHFHPFTCSKNVSPSVVPFALSKVIRWVEENAITAELQGENISGIF